MLTRFSRFALLSLGLAATAVGLTGCVGQGEYDRLYSTNASLSSTNAELESQNRELRLQIDQLRRGYGQGEGAISDLQKQNAELRRLLDEAMGNLKDVEGRMAGLSFGRLDATTDQALQEFAARYPQLVTYDAARGMLRFASDLTFDSGSAVVKDSARQALAALSEILKSDSAAAYEVVIEGHTDSQRISAGTAQRHPTNRHLSAHRAISVIDELNKLGVPSGRMMAAGWGEHRPAVQNNTNGNTPANRRVEIFLAKSRGGSTPAPAAPGTRSTPRATPRAAEPEMDITK